MNVEIVIRCGQSHYHSEIFNFIRDKSIQVAEVFHTPEIHPFISDSVHAVIPTLVTSGHLLFACTIASHTASAVLFQLSRQICLALPTNEGGASVHFTYQCVALHLGPFFLVCQILAITRTYEPALSFCSILDAMGHPWYFRMKLLWSYNFPRPINATSMNTHLHLARFPFFPGQGHQTLFSTLFNNSLFSASILITTQ